MFGLFQKNLVKTGLLKGALDRHSHLLPGVDDGARTMEESQKMITGLKALGFKGAFCTPHIMARYPDNTPSRLKERFEELQAQREEDGFELHLAAEYMLDEQFLEKLDREEPLTYDGTRILVELPQLALPRDWQEMVFQIKTRGLIPVFAHPERYWHLLRDDQDRELLQEGCEFQLNLLSLSGYYGKRETQFALRFIKEGLYSCIGSDLHSERQLHAYTALKLPDSFCSSLRNRINTHTIS